MSERTWRRFFPQYLAITFPKNNEVEEGHGGLPEEREEWQGWIGEVNKKIQAVEATMRKSNNSLDRKLAEVNKQIAELRQKIAERDEKIECKIDDACAKVAKALSEERRQPTSRMKRRREARN